MSSLSSIHPFPYYYEMQKERPVFFDPDYALNWGHKGVWHVFRYEDVVRVLKDYETFTSEGAPKVEESPLSIGISQTDPPRHTSLRKIVTKAFVPRVINKMEPWIRQVSEELLDKVLDQGEMEFVDDFAIPIPVRVITRMMGVPANDVKQVNEWANLIMLNPDEVEGGPEGFFRAQQEMGEFFKGLIEERKQNLKDDLISDLIRAEVDGEKLGDEDLLSFCMVLLIAGNETTTNLLGNTIYTLTEHPEIQDHLLEHPEDIPKVVEESLRYRSPVQSLFRVATKDVEIAGQKIKQGEYVVAWLGSANHDPSVFPNPEKFDIERDNSSKVSFGHGIHYCVGAPLATLEANVALQVIFSKIKQIRIKPGVKVERFPSTMMYGLKKLPITFQLQ